MAIYMKFGNVNGQVTTEGFKQWIELSSMQLGVGRGVSSGAGGQTREASNPSISEVSVTKMFDASSAGLFEDGVAGSFDTKVQIKFTTTTKTKVDTYLTYDLTDCGVSGYSISSGGDNPTESISLNFTKIMISPSPLDIKGVPQSGSKVTYDLIKMTKS
ncbi:type VI secretion system tube protein Hcp [Pararoseomonas sp. SCSIO 73927]|uniref:Hcp family type VI secretion system effector n=1 Tax=Pararoseomonas sp. SCSIO 73927 TaxID=3114537 RepID=UPI0030CB7DE1